MCDNASYVGLIGAIIGGYITYRVYEKSRRQKSVYDIADFFGEEARIWTHKKYEPGMPEFVKWHNDSIDHLSANVGYLDRNHKEICRKIWPDWVAYHGGDAGKPIDYNSYYVPEIREKAYWLERLYHIADILRGS